MKPKQNLSFAGELVGRPPGHRRRHHGQVLQQDETVCGAAGTHGDGHALIKFVAVLFVHVEMS